MVAFRDCVHCQQWQYNEETGEVEIKFRQPVPRIMDKGRPATPCLYGPTKCPKVSPDAGLGLSLKNWAAYTHYRECKAVGQFPDDPTVRRNAAIIDAVYRGEAQRREDMFRLELKALLR